MAIGFNSDVEEEEEYAPLYRTIIECPVCNDDLTNHYKGACSCGNLEIGQLESKSKVRHVVKSTWTHFKTVTYSKVPPKIYEVLLVEELP